MQENMLQPALFSFSHLLLYGHKMQTLNTKEDKKERMRWLAYIAGGALFV